MQAPVPSPADGALQSCWSQADPEAEEESFKGSRTFRHILVVPDTLTEHSLGALCQAQLLCSATYRLGEVHIGAKSPESFWVTLVAVFPFWVGQVATSEQDGKQRSIQPVLSPDLAPSAGLGETGLVHDGTAAVALGCKWKRTRGRSPETLLTSEPLFLPSLSFLRPCGC